MNISKEAPRQPHIKKYKIYNDQIKAYRYGDHMMVRCLSFNYYGTLVSARDYPQVFQRLDEYDDAMKAYKTEVERIASEEAYFMANTDPVMRKLLNRVFEVPNKPELPPDVFGPIHKDEIPFDIAKPQPFSLQNFLQAAIEAEKNDISRSKDFISHLMQFSADLQRLTI